MSEAEVERLFRAIEALRTDVQDYRNDLHTLEVKLAEMETREEQRSMSKSQVYRFLFFATAVISTSTAIVVQLVDRI